MKKLIGTVAVAAMAATAAFAEISLGSWGRVIGVPLANNGKDTVAGQTQSWGGYGRATGIDFVGSSEDGTAGFKMSYRNTTENPGWDSTYDAHNMLGEDANFWVKPVDMVKLTMGKVENNSLRGDFCYGSWDWMRPGFYNDEGLTFSNFAGTGMMFELTPVEGLYVLAAVPLDNKFGKAGDVYKKAQFGFGYTIEGVGKLKAQYIGKGDVKVDAVTAGWYDGNGASHSFDAEKAAKGEYTYKASVDAKDGNSNCDIEAAFDLTAVENLFVTAGFTYHNVKDIAADAEQMKVGLGISYQVSDVLKVFASGKLVTIKDADNGMAFGAGLSYVVTDGITLDADVRLIMEHKNAAKAVDQEQQVAAFAGISKGFSNASLGIGFQCKTNCKAGTSGYGWSLTCPEADKKMIWAVPVVLSAWF